MSKYLDTRLSSNANNNNGSLNVNGTIISPTELSYLSGAISNMQTQLNATQDTITDVSNTELGYLDGVQVQYKHN